MAKAVKKKNQLIKYGVLIVLLLLIIFAATKLLVFREELLSEPTPYCTLEKARVEKKDSYTDKELQDYQRCAPILVYFKENASEQEAREFIEGIKKVHGVYKADYTSKEQAVRNYKELNKNEPLFIEIMPEGLPLPAFAEVYVSDPNIKNGILETIRSDSTVDTAN